MTPPTVSQHPSSMEPYIRHGWSLVPIPPGTKGPAHRGWNLRANALTLESTLPPGYGIGLAHAYSGTSSVAYTSHDSEHPASSYATLLARPGSSPCNSNNLNNFRVSVSPRKNTR